MSSHHGQSTDCAVGAEDAEVQIARRRLSRGRRTMLGRCGRGETLGGGGGKHGATVVSSKDLEVLEGNCRTQHFFQQQRGLHGLSLDFS